MPRQSDGTLTTDHGKRLCCDMTQVLDGETPVNSYFLADETVGSIWKSSSTIHPDGNEMKLFQKSDFRATLLKPLNELWDYKHAKVEDLEDMIKTKVYELKCPWTKTLKRTRRLEREQVDKIRESTNDWSKCHGSAYIKGKHSTTGTSSSTSGNGTEDVNDCVKYSSTGKCSYSAWKRYVRDNNDFLIDVSYPDALTDASKYSLAKSVNIGKPILYNHCLCVCSGFIFTTC